jgi:hypothetical protein
MGHSVHAKRLRIDFATATSRIAGRWNTAICHLAPGTPFYARSVDDDRRIIKEVDPIAKLRGVASAGLLLTRGLASARSPARLVSEIR